MENILQKIKLDSFKHLCLLHIPSDLESQFKQYSTVECTQNHDALFCFTTSNQAFFENLESLVKSDLLSDKGTLFIAYPKKGNKKYSSYVHRDEIFPKVAMDDDGFIYNSFYRFNRMLGFNDEFTLLEIKKELNFKPSSKVSMQGKNYLQFIPMVEAYLEKDENALRIYQSLTPGYKKDWAVYMYSTQNEITRLKRYEECIKILNLGFKNMTLYRQSLKK